MEQQKAIEALRAAMKVEQDARTCYLEASRLSNNELGRRLLRAVAEETDVHHDRFREVYESLQAKGGWPATKPALTTGGRLRADFEKTCALMGASIETVEGELDALQTALQQKDRTYQFYVRQEAEAASPLEKELYAALAREERTHYLVLLDYFEYIKDPGAWFTTKERPHLDGA